MGNGWDERTTLAVSVAALAAMAVLGIVIGYCNGTSSFGYAMLATAFACVPAFLLGVVVGMTGRRR